MGDEAPDEARVHREAADWFARLNSRTISTQALKEFRDWRAAPANAAAYAALEDLWRKAGQLQADPDIAAAVAAALHRPVRPKGLTAGWKALDPRALRALVIAGLAVAAAVVLVATHGMRMGLAYASGVGEQRLITLEDGTRLRLDTDTRLRVRFDGSARRVDLARGRAFFDVAHDPARPFTVAAGAAEVRALGTRFDVRRDDGQVQVTLVEGRVHVEEAGNGAPGRWTLEPGQQLTIGPKPSHASPRPVDVAAATSWTSGRLVFQSTPLSDAIAEVNRYSRKPLRLEAEGLARTPISGVFDAGDVEAFATAVASLYDLEAEPRDGGLVLRARSAG